jgi:hypothetical protein
MDYGLLFLLFRLWTSQFYTMFVFKLNVIETIRKLRVYSNIWIKPEYSEDNEMHVENLQ